MTDPNRDRNKHEPESSPYGPQPHGVDETSGGADSSPFENQPSGEKGRAADEEKKNGRRPALGPS